MTEPRAYFINASCFGDDVARWLIGELKKQGMKTEENPGQEDFGWYLNFEVTGSAYTFVIGHRPANKSDAGVWVGWLERKRGFIASIIGGRQRGIEPAASEVIDKILSNSPLIRDVHWQFRRDFDKQ